MKTSRPRRLLHYLCIVRVVLCTYDQSSDQRPQQQPQQQHRHHQPGQQQQSLLRYIFEPQPPSSPPSPPSPQQPPDSGPTQDQQRAPTMVDYELLHHLLEEGHKCSCSQSRLLPHFGAIATTSVAILGHSTNVDKAKSGETITGFGRLRKSSHPKAMKGVSSVLKGNVVTMPRGKGDGLAGM